MWINKEKYNKLIEENGDLKYRLNKNNNSCLYCRKNMNELLTECNNKLIEAEENMNELKKYKQMYADEVQKRLDLIERYEGK